MIPEGYHPRIDGAEAHYPIGESGECDSCGETASILYGYERNYPEDADLEVCSDCHIEWMMEH